MDWIEDEGILRKMFAFIIRFGGKVVFKDQIRLFKLVSHPPDDMMPNYTDKFPQFTLVYIHIPFLSSMLSIWILIIIL